MLSECLTWLKKMWWWEGDYGKVGKAWVLTQTWLYHLLTLGT